MARRVEYKHNQVALLDPNMSEAVNFQGIINFLNLSRFHVALSANPYISLPYIQQFWDTVHQDTDVEPHVLRATVNNTEVAISVETIRAALALGGAVDDPMSYPGTLIIGCFQRMGYRGRPNDTQARKGGLVGKWIYFMHVIIQCMYPRKAGTDGLKCALQAAMVSLTLNKWFNFALYIYSELVMQINPLEGQGFLMYPRFVQMILNHLIPDFPQHPIRLTLTPMSKRIFTDCTKVKQQNVALIPVPTPLFGYIINHDYVEPPNDHWFHPEELVQGQVQNQVPIQQPVQAQVQQIHILVNEPVQEEIAQDNDQDLGMNMDDFDHEAVNSPIYEVEGNVVDTSSDDTILPDSEATDTDSSRDFSSDHYARLATLPLANAGKRIKSRARKPRCKSVWNPPSGSVLGKRTLIDESSDSNSDAILVPKAQKLMSASIATAHSSQGVKDANFVASLLITPPASNHTSPVLSPHVPHTSEAGPSKPSDSERITFLESQVLALQTQLLVSKLVERLDAQGELRIHDTCLAELIQRKDNDDNDPSGNVEGDHQYADVNPISRAQGESSSHTIEGTKHDSGVNEEILLLEFFQDSEEEEAEKLECLDDIDELFDDDEEDVLDNEVEEGEIVEIEIEKGKSKVTYEGSDGLNVPYKFIQDDVIPEFSYDGVTDSMDSVEDITTPDDTAQFKIDYDVDTTHTVSPKLNEEPVMYRNVNTGEARIDGKDNKVIVRLYDAMNLINFSKKDQRTLRKNEIMFTYEWREQGLQYKRVLEIC
ncbi:hypothetical protein L1987_85792 [Smallanthus sonchifolius]|uniref:Uncharacterized protein n=1 Tax=Smallanthus sonchifolius TaxID=185202 RepID=A0ACB8XYK8_9ASTR|nr:hypothetical protein L1987_85792 [Smallanthus sonchifolius]